MCMDTFTSRHLKAYADSVCFDDERDGFLAYATSLDPEDLAYYTDEVGWPALLNRYRDYGRAK